MYFLLKSCSTWVNIRVTLHPEKQQGSDIQISFLFAFSVKLNIFPLKGGDDIFLPLRVTGWEDVDTVQDKNERSTFNFERYDRLHWHCESKQIGTVGIYCHNTKQQVPLLLRSTSFIVPLWSKSFCRNDLKYLLF